MALQLSNFTAALKEVVLPYIRDNYPKEKILLDQMKRNAGGYFINDEFIAPVRTSRHGGVSNLADDGNNVVSSNGVTTSRGTISTKLVSGAFDISDLVMKATKTSQGAVESALTFQTKTLAEDFGRHLNRQMYWDGIGVVTQARQTGGSVSGTEIAVEALGNGTGPDDGRVQDWYGTINGDVSPTKYVTAGQVIGIGTGAAAVGTIAATTGTSIQLNAAKASAASDSIYILDGSGEGAGTSEFTGIKAALSSSTGTSTYAGLARNVVGWAPQFGSSNEALGLSRMEDSYLSAREYAQSGDKFIILVNKSLFKKYGDILTAMRRSVDKVDLIGGFKGLEFVAGDANVGVVLDYDVPDGEVIILNLDTWTMCEVSPLDWLSGGDGEPLWRLQNTTTYQATMVYYANVLCLGPAANGHETRKTD